MEKIGNTAFLSYRGQHFDRAQRLAVWLTGSGACVKATLMPPFALAADGEVLLPYEFFELMEPIIDHIAHADAFVALVDGYDSSYFTQAEFFQWCRFAKKSVVWAARETGEGEFEIAMFPHEPATHEQKKLWAKISTSIHPQMKGRGASIWGKYARQCYLIPCRHCGEHVLATRKVVEPAAETRTTITCPHCSAAIGLAQLPQRGNYYRKPIVLTDTVGAAMRPLEQNEMLDLLVTNDEPPPRMKFVSVPGEKIATETMTLATVFGVLLVGGALLFSGIFSKDEP